ncbi:MAG: MFS transporter, partial [Chloroflexota bacterium]|nr:MFS transporter [Chloroflexota bacterium]
DPAAVILVSTGAVALIWGMVQAGNAGWGSVPVLAALGLGSALLLGFVAWERRALDPMLPLRLFHSRTFDAAIATGFVMMAAQYSAAFLITQYLQAALGNAPFAAGLRFLPMTATPLVVAPIAGMLSDRIGPRPLMVTGMALQALGLGWFALVANAGAGYAQLIVPLLVAGIGVSMPFATVASATLSAVALVDTGKASGVNSMALTFGGAFGIAVVTAVFAAHDHPGTSAGFVAGLRPALLVAAGLASLGALSALGAGGRLAAGSDRTVARHGAESPTGALAMVSGSERHRVSVLQS